MEKKNFICSRNDDVHCALSWDFLFSKQSDQKYYNRNWNYSRYIKSKIDNKVYKIESGKCIIWSDHLDSARNFYIFWCEISFINDSARLIFLSTVSMYYYEMLCYFLSILLKCLLYQPRKNEKKLSLHYNQQMTEIMTELFSGSVTTFLNFNIFSSTLQQLHTKIDHQNSIKP